VTAAEQTDTAPAHPPADDAPPMSWALWWAREQRIAVFPLGDRIEPGSLAGVDAENDPSKKPRRSCVRCWRRRRHEHVPPERCYAQCGHGLCHGLLGATTDPDLIRDWWTQHPEANIGAATGPISDLFGVDTDPEDDGPAALAALIDQHGGDWPVTWQHRTGSGGDHYLFCAVSRNRRNGTPFGNSQRVLGAGIDTRGAGGYLVLPPSVSNKGRYSIVAARPRSTAPDWALDSLDKTRAPAPVTSRNGHATGTEIAAAARVLVDAQLAQLRTETSGRNGKLNTTAYTVGGVVAHPDAGITRDQALAELLDAATANGYVAKDGIAAARATAESGLDSGIARSLEPWPPTGRNRPATAAEAELIAEIETILRDVLADNPRMLTDLLGGVPDAVNAGDFDDWLDGITDAASDAVTEEDDTPTPVPEPEPTVRTITGADGRVRIVGRPQIRVPNRDHAELRTEVVNTVKAVNTADPRLFRWGSNLGIQGDGARVQLLDSALLTTALSDRIEFVRVQRGDDGTLRTSPHKPPADVVASMLSGCELLPLPRLERVTAVPFLTPDGGLWRTPGYCHAARTLYAPEPGLTIPPVPSQPSRDQIAAARALILNEVLPDFPFVTRGDLAAAVALMLLPFVRSRIDGPTPLHGIDAPVRGAGKGLLVRACLTPAVGADRPPVAPPETPEEWAKTIVATLQDGRPTVLLDNLDRPLRSSHLASVLTAWPTFSGRILGYSQMAMVPVPSVWAATGNNLRASSEVARRIVRIRLDPQVERPEERTGFRHDDLGRWVDAHRGQLIAACLTLAQAWVAAGQPRARLTLGSFEEWAAIMGGILDVAGIPGLLRNRSDWLESGDADQLSWRAVLQAWAELAETQRRRDPKRRPEFTASQLAAHLIAQEVELPFDLVPGGKPRAQATTVGAALASQRGRRLDGWRIESRGPVGGRMLYRLERA
jgi:hypothetical protein